MAFEISGKLIEKFETIQVSDKFRKREFVIEKTETAGSTEFSNYVKFQLTQDRCDLIEAFHTNDEIKISFNIKGNRWERDGKVSYFTNLDVWRIDKPGDKLKGPDEDASFPGESDIPEVDVNGADDLPF